MNEKNTSEEKSSHQNSAQVIDHTCDDNGINLLNTEEKSYFKSIHYINATNDIYMNYNDKIFHKYYAAFLSSKKYEYDSAKRRVCCNKNIILDLLLNTSNRF